MYQFECPNYDWYCEERSCTYCQLHPIANKEKEGAKK